MAANSIVVSDEIARIRNKNPGLDVNRIEILETRKRFSECMIWGMLEDFYQHAGPAAWDAIPYYPTSNPGIAEIYASCITAYLIDSIPSIDKSRPVYILELAAGHSLFAFYVMKELVRKVGSFACLQDVQLRYIMTDFTENNVESWEHCQELRPFLESGMLDFAVFKPEEDTALRLRRSGCTLAAGSGTNPVIAIANYFFDSLRQDFFHVDNGQLREALVTFYRKIATKSDVPSFDNIEKIDSYIDVEKDYYGETHLDGLLNDYIRTIDKGSIPFPLGALRCIENLESISNGNLVLMVTDKGYCTNDSLMGLCEVPYVPLHGCTSFMVNFDALSRYFENKGGDALVSFESYELNTAIYLSPRHPGLKLEHLRCYVNDLLDRRGASGAYCSVPGLLKTMDLTGGDPNLTFRQCVAAIQISNYDPMTFSLCGKWLSSIFSALSVHQQRQLKLILRKVEENMHPRAPCRKEASDWLRSFYFALGMDDECLSNAKETVVRYGEDGHAFYYMGICFECRGEYEVAMECIRKAAALDENCELTKAAMGRVEKRLIGDRLGEGS
ncbi:MAG: hypothetical protein WED00_07755 [Aquisalimonadaceae bacterium]